MNRTDRLLAIVLELQGRGWRRAADLAATFETSKRTIYRDLSALGQAGVPVVSQPGRGYALVAGYFLPPLSFTADEATMLLLGGDVMAQNFDAQYRAAAESAGRKIAGVLPERLRPDVEAARASIRFIAEDARGEARGRTEERERLRLLRRAILDRHTVRFRYFPRFGADDTSDAEASAELPAPREADPYGLAHVRGVWYLTGRCHLRRDTRTFRLDRMEDLAVLEATTFARPPGVAPRDRDAEAPDSVVVRVLFAPPVARWVRESSSYFTVAEEESPDGLLVTLRARREEEVVQWLLGWGRHVRVLAPESLRRRIAAEAETMLRTHENAP